MTPAADSPLERQLVAAHATFLAERAAGADEDVHMLAQVVGHVIERCTQPGDLVLDPFAGFGTTLERAVALGRRAVGVELLPERVDLVRERVPNARIIEGDARGLAALLRAAGAGVRDADPRLGTDSLRAGDPRCDGDPRRDTGHFDLVLTSPPYMTSNDHEADPLTAYEADGGDYGRYLSELGLVAAQCARVLRPGGYLVCNVADIRHRGHTTQLIADCGRVFAEWLTPLPTTEIVWDRYPHDLVADALLVFQRPDIART